MTIFAKQNKKNKFLHFLVSCTEMSGWTVIYAGGITFERSPSCRPGTILTGLTGLPESINHSDQCSVLPMFCCHMNRTVSSCISPIDNHLINIPEFLHDLMVIVVSSDV